MLTWWLNACDNCRVAADRDQLDTDSDNIGNMCDCGFNQDNFCGGLDFTLYAVHWWFQCRDQRRSGVCGGGHEWGWFCWGPDFTLFIGGFNGAPGPSGL
jgi:hypothetical protein